MLGNLGGLVALILKGVGYLGWVICAGWSFFLNLGIISDIAGFWGLVVALTIAPVTFLAAPLYVGFKFGNWFPFQLGYGGSSACLLLVLIGSMIEGD